MPGIFRKRSFNIWQALVDANVEVTLEIKADVPNGVSEKIVRDVTENCRTLKFDTYGFEKE